MGRPRFVKYSSPDFIAAVRSLRSTDVKPRGWLFLLQAGADSNHIKAGQYIAFESNLELLKVELSNVVGKYIGETEKNLTSVLEQTEASHAILFFDEADSLFGRRSDQKQAAETCQMVRKAIDEAQRIVILSMTRNENIEKSLLEQIDVVVEFRNLK